MSYGTATIEIDGEVIILHDHEGVEVPPNAQHQMMNMDCVLEFLVISQPMSKEDRVHTN